MRSVQMRERREVVRAVLGLRQNLDHRHAVRAERVGNQRAVTSPGHRFGAHDGDSLLRDLVE